MRTLSWALGSPTHLLSWVPGSPTHPLSWVPGSPIQLRPLGWASGAAAPEKVPAFFEFAGTFFCAKPIETHWGSFHCAIWLDAGTFDFKISYRPANKLTDAAGTVYFPAFSTGSGHNKLTSQNILWSIPPHKPYPVDIPSSQKLISDSRMESSHAPYIAVILTRHFYGMQAHPPFPDAPKETAFLFSDAWL